MSDLKSRLQDEMKAALRAGEKERLGTIRLVIAAVKQKEIDSRTELDDNGVLAVLDRMAKQRRESISQFEMAGRGDLVAKEQTELELLREFMPSPLTEPEINALVAAAVEETGASSIKDMGAVMGKLKPALQGRADMGAVSVTVRNRLSG
ncbi:MAG: GatB/YqeY domain-containing protein [Pseudomonadota bacterium]|nr:GatB/YqeY domain-containing protein [Pseudomonadota bacterium]